MENFVKNSLKITSPHFVPFFPTSLITTLNQPYQHMKLTKILGFLSLDLLLINPPYYY